jgi:tetratricopeptide (TPR) repeat protein
LADEAISYRNVGNYDKAFRLLKRAIDRHDYRAAIALVGTTAVMKGDIEGAIEWFSFQLRTLPDNGDYCLIELYANLGSIYNQYVQNYDRALEMYEKGLAAHPPVGIDRRGYDQMVTNAHRDMTIVYQNLGDLSRAKEYAQRVLRNSADDDIVKSRDHLRLARILLEMGEYAEVQDHAKSGIESFRHNRDPSWLTVAAKWSSGLASSQRPRKRRARIRSLFFCDLLHAQVSYRRLRMNIYIDESGIFRNTTQQSNIASVVAALVLPTSQRAEIVKEFRTLTRHWPHSDGEIKGKDLDEDQVAAVVALLKRHPVCLEAKVIDVALTSEAEITTFKTRQADNITANLTSTHHPDVVKQATEMREAFLNMSNPLFVQAFLMMMLIMDLFPKMPHYYARRTPQELGKFHWIVDAKDKQLTEFEKAWSLTVYAVMGTWSFKKPFIPIDGGDYSYLERYKVTNKEDLDYFREIAVSRNKEAVGKRIGIMSLKKLLGESFKFQDSKRNTGLQLVDVLVNAIQRALNNKLQPHGWRDIGSLMITPPDLVSFNTGTEQAGSEVVVTPFYRVLETLKQNAKSLWTKED